jgi:hypothetical protein
LVQLLKSNEVAIPRERGMNLPAGVRAPGATGEDTREGGKARRLTGSALRSSDLRSYLKSRILYTSIRITTVAVMAKMRIFR